MNNAAAISTKSKQFTRTFSHPAFGKDFAVKVNNLQTFNQAISNNEELPNAKDILNCVKYFQSTLLSWIKDEQSCFLIDSHTFDHARFPSANYCLLYETLITLLGLAHNIEDNEELIDTLVKTLSCTLPFLPDEMILAVPITFAEVLYDVPAVVQVKLIDLLCQYVIPLIYVYMTPDIEDEMGDMNLCVPSLLASVLDATSDVGVWTKVMECLMRFKRNISTDLLTVLAYGTRESLEASVHLLNRYFPPVDIDRRPYDKQTYNEDPSVKAYQSPPYESITPFCCQSHSCVQLDKPLIAAKVCLDPSFCSSYKDEVPPLYFCQRCFDTTENLKDKLTLDVTQPVTLVSQVCDNIDCRFGFMKALYFCFSFDCIKKNENKPIRLCQDCHARLHINLEFPHMNHECLKELWITPNAEQTYLVDAIVRLWNEAQPDFHEKCLQMGLELENFVNESSSTVYLEKMFRSFHGLYLLKTTCPVPPSQYHLEHLTRLFAMLLIWVESVDYASHPRVEPIVKQSRQQAIAWINKVLQYDPNLYGTCLLPNPPSYAQVGHPWNLLTSVVRKDMEILQRIVTLTKRELIPEQIWDHIMPHWLQELKENIPSAEIKRFKKILGKLFDIKSDVRPSYAIDFIKKRLESSIMRQSQEGLVWVQILSYLDVQMDIKNLLEMFIEMVLQRESNVSVVAHDIPSAFPFPNQEILKDVGKLSRQNSVTTPLSANVPVLMNLKNDSTMSILMMDVLIKQLTLQRSADGIVYVAQKESTCLSLLLVCILDQTFTGKHSDHRVEADCNQCKLMNVTFYQLTLLVDLAVKHQVTMDQVKYDYSKSIILRTSSNASKHSRVSLGSPSGSTKYGADGVFSIPIEEEGDDDRGEIEKEIAAREASDPEVVTEETAQNEPLNDLQATEKDKHDNETTKTQCDGAEIENEMLKLAELQEKLQELPFTKSNEEQQKTHRRQSNVSDSELFAIPELQILEKLLQELLIVQDAAVVIHILNSLEILCIRGECLQMVAEHDINLLQKLQTQSLIPILWNLLKSSVSNIAHKAVLLLFHCAGLPYGAKKLCSEIEDNFSNEDWKIRFTAVDKIGLLCQFVTDDFVHESSLAQSSLVHGFTFLTFAVDDVSQVVALRARNIIESLKRSSMKLIYVYLENYFSLVEDDRLLLLLVYRTINRVIPESSPLDGELFIKLFQKITHFDGKKKRKLFHDATVATDAYADSSFISMSSRRFPMFQSKPVLSTLSKSSSKAGVAPITFYQNSFTLQGGKSWRAGYSHVEKTGAVSAVFRRQQSMCGETLDTVSEECATEIRNSITLQSTVATDIGASFEDEMITFLLVLFIDFLLSITNIKNTVIKEKTRFQEIREIIGFIGQLMGLEKTVTFAWRLPKKFNPKEFRKNPIAVTYMMNLPKLLDGETTRGEFFLPLSIQVMLAFVKHDVVDSSWKSSLVLLEPNLQKVWLTTFLLILYKYNFNDDSDMSEATIKLIDIVLNTLNGHGQHECVATKKGKDKLSMRNVVAIKINSKKKIKSKFSLAAEDIVLDIKESVNHNDEQLSESSTLDSRIMRVAAEQASSSRVKSTEELLLEHESKLCPLCKVPMFDYQEETINLCIVVLLTFVHMDAEMAAPHIICIVQSVTRKAQVVSPFYPNKPPRLSLTPTASIAQQFLRCIYHKLAQSRLFSELFCIPDLDYDFHLVMATILTDFPHLTQICPLKLTVNDLTKGNVCGERFCVALSNLVTYHKLVLNHPQWEALQKSYEEFYSSVIPMIPNRSNMDPLLDIMSMLLQSQKTKFMVLIDLIDDIMTHIIKNCHFSCFSLRALCIACYDTFSKERDQMRLTRKISAILATLLSSKLALPESSIVALIKFFCIDVGTVFDFEIFDDNQSKPGVEVIEIKLKAMECLDEYFHHEIVDYLKAPSERIKENQFVDKSNIDYFQSIVKLSIAQIVAVYLSKTENTQSRLRTKLLSFLSVYDDFDQQNNWDPQSLDIYEQILHCRAISWLLTAALNHLNHTNTHLPVVLTSNSVNMAEFTKSIFDNLLNGEASFWKIKGRKQLRFTFLLAQIWTIYMEKLLPHHIQSNVSDINPLVVVKEFWSRLIPVLYTLLQKDKKLQFETIQLFSSLVENLSVHCPRTFTQLYPLWVPMLQLYLNEIPVNVVRKINSVHTAGEFEHGQTVNNVLTQWLADVRKMLWTTEKVGKGKQTSMSILNPPLMV